MNEDPDKVDLGGEALHWEDGLTFCLFDNYGVCSKDGREVVHSDIIREVASCEDAIRMGLEGRLTPQQVSDCINDADSPMATNDVLETYGVPSRRAMELMLLAAEGIRNNVASRAAVSLAAPEVVHGRIWLESRVVSFWNGNSTMMRSRGNVLGFVAALTGEERRFRYEVANVLMDHGQFSSGSFPTRPVVFDPSKVHAMVPGPVRDALRSGPRGSLSPRYAGLAARMRSYTGD